jgi:hypothetical protein
MKKKNSSNTGKVTSVYHPERVRSLMRAIKENLEASQGRPILYEELAQYAGQAISSVFDKLQKTHQPQVEALVGWLERLPEATRTQLMNSHCRSYPTLEHPRVAHDPAQVSRLKTLLTQGSGFTIIKGGNDSLRTFVVSALCHSKSILQAERRVAWGLDIHQPDWFVPVEGVIYLNNLLDPLRLTECVNRHWSIQFTAGVQIVILNGVWSATQRLEQQIAELGARCHLIVADEQIIKIEDQWRRTKAPIHVLTLSEEKESRIRVGILQT